MTTQVATAGLRERLGSIPADALLRLSLKLDAAITGANGIAYIAAAGVLDSALGYSQGVLIGAGAFLVAFAAAVLAVATRPAISRTAIRAIVAANGVWAIGSIAIALGDVLSATTAGTVWLVMQAMTVAGFAALQGYALRRGDQRPEGVA